MNPLPAAALNQHVAVLGKTGSGKTYAAKGIVEGLLADDRQVCVLDPTGAWWGLRLAHDGKARGFDVVLLGGEHADIPLAERSGAAVARLVTEQHARVVIDTSGFTVGQYTRWFIDFAGTLYTTIRAPLHLIIDEAHYFAPQGKTPDVDAGKMLHAANRLMSGGRSKGIRGMLITQRPAKLHKDSLTCADTLIAMRVIAPQDRGAIKDWIDGSGNAEDGRRVLDSLASLERGEGWVWYPEGGYLERVKFPKIKTYDSSRTPEHGGKAGPKVAEIRLDDVREAMAEAVREAEANDPKLLRARIVELERAAKGKALAPAAVVVADAALSTLRAKHDELSRTYRVVVGLAEDRQRRLDAIRAAVLKGTEETSAVIPPAPKLNGHAPRPKPAPRVASADSPAGLVPRHGRILAAIALCNEMGTENPTREQVAFWVGVSSTSSSYANDLSALRTAGAIEYATPGTLALRVVPPLMAEMPTLSTALDRLEPRHRRMLTAVCNFDRLSRDLLAEKVGASPTSSSFANDISAMRTAGLITYPSKGEVAAADWLAEALGVRP